MTADRVNGVKIQLDCLSSTDIRVVNKIFKEKGPVSDYKELLNLFTEASDRYYEILNIEKGKSDTMAFSDMVKNQRNKDRGIRKSVMD